MVSHFEECITVALSILVEHVSLCYKGSKAIPVTGLEAHRVVGRRGSHILLDNRLIDGGVRAGRFLPPGRLLVLIHVRHWHVCGRHSDSHNERKPC
jgi:hypothetical protein